MMKVWIAKLRRENFVPTRNTKICSDHFEPECFTYQKTTNYRLLKPNSVPTIFTFSKNSKRTSHTVGCGVVNDPSKADANGKMQFAGYRPGREPRGQAQRKTFKDFIMSKEASDAQSKLTETNERLAVLHKRRLMLRASAKSKSSKSATLLCPPYESHFVNYKGKSSSSSPKKRLLKRNSTSGEPLNDSSVDDPPVKENSSDDEESSIHSDYLSSEESWRGSALNSDESSSSLLYQSPEVNLSSDESSADSPSYKNVSLKEKKSKTTSALDESNLSSDENSKNLVTFISKLSSPISSVSSPNKSENVTESSGLQKLLTPLDNNSGDKKSHKLLSKKSAVPSPNSKLFKFKHSIQPKILKEKDSSIAKHLQRDDPVHKYYLERLASDKNIESSDALFSNSFRWEIANYKGKLKERLVRARREKMKLRKKITNLRRSTEYWRRKNANLKCILEEQNVEEDS